MLEDEVPDIVHFISGEPATGVLAVWVAVEVGSEVTQVGL